MNYHTTCVSALYDIGRTGIDGRTIHTYVEWLKRTLTQIREPFVLFLDPTLHLEDEFKDLRDEPIHICSIPKQELVMWKYETNVKAILESDAFRSLQKYPNDITNRLHQYTLLQHSKLEFMNRAIQENPFQSVQFAWIDGGLSRFLNPMYRYSIRETITDTMLIEVNSSIRNLSKLTYDTYIGTCERIVWGGAWITTPSVFQTVYENGMRIFKEEMIAKGRIDNEQITLALILKENPLLFDYVMEGEGDNLIKTIFSIKTSDRAV